ncbi:PAQR family membrane homeostasis protein TrhA [Sporosalibacterium faouarense]|uniref:PAQR family membrane homeostasis protein TrhA n=1 Tax=Sporosalibacterium faouarense TaxID=516123 RepID=UPI00141D2B77|nr:hemolysin III family protein [Sporosalibacterium faouarense]MTI49170.1 hemolysin III family protein [Bacillota bacterium]
MDVQSINQGKVKVKRRYTLKEEIANSITHGIGILFSVVTLTILLVFAISNRSTIYIVSFSIYGFCSIALYVASTLYHSFQNEKIKKILRVFDHSSIYLFIAGTYTPITLLSMKGYWRIGMITAVWTIALFGIGFKIVTYNKFDKYNFISTILYIAMGWIVVIAIKPMLETTPIGLLLWLIAGGVVYTVGTIFYAMKKIPYAHAAWHLFVLAGSVLHFIGIFIYLK